MPHWIVADMLSSVNMHYYSVRKFGWESTSLALHCYALKLVRKNMADYSHGTLIVTLWLAEIVGWWASWNPPCCIVMHCAVWWQAVFGPGDDYQVVPDLTMVEALEESADGLRITGQRECVFVFPSMSWSQNHRSEGVRFCLCSHWCHGLRITEYRILYTSHYRKLQCHLTYKKHIKAIANKQNKQK